MLRLRAESRKLWQRIPGRRSRNSKTLTTITVQSITRNDHLPLTGGLQMSTDDVGCLCTTVHHVQRSCSMKTSVHQHGKLELYSVGRTSGVRSAVPRQAAIELPKFRVLLTTRTAEFITLCNLMSVVTALQLVNARSHKRMDECCC